jgi:four helix bundle protein
MSNPKKPYDLKARTKLFAIEILHLIDDLPKKKSSSIISYQLGRSGSSVAANYRASQRAKSTKDFINKLKISEEECDESKFWLEILIESGLADTPQLRELLIEADELLAILVASIQKTRRNNPK